MDDKEFNKKYESLKKSKFKQQKLLGWRPIPTISCITIIFISFAVFFILFGIIILVFTSQVKEMIVRYDNNCNFTKKNPCDFTIPVPEKMKKPIMVYYQINDFSQNHRVYMDSKSDKQLNGDSLSVDELKESGVCDYAITNKDMGETGRENEAAFPCGLMAKSYFRDYFTFEMNGNKINVKNESIAYKTDKEKYEKNTYDKNKHWIDFTDERFMIWMRPSPFSNPRKLWGIIDDIDIDSSIYFTVKEQSFGGYEKYVIFSTRNVFGGKNSFLGAIYLIFGIICLVSAIVFINLHHIYHKKD